MPKPQAKIGTMLDLLQKNPEATQADLAELEAATQPRRPPVIRASTLSERIRDKYYDLFESAARQPIGRLADALGLSDLQGIANERATGGKLMMASAAPLPSELPLERVGPTVRALRGAMAEAVGSRTMPAPRGRLDRTLELVNGDLRLKPDVVDRLGMFHEVGGRLPNAANWDGADHQDLLGAFGGNRGAAEVYGQQWGATSPNTDVLRNTLESEVSQLYQLTHGGEPIPLSLAQFPDPVNSGKQLLTSAGSKIPNIGRALRGEELSGPKVREMGNYAAGRTATPIDVHTMYAMGSKYDKLDEHDLPAVKAWLGRKLGLPESHAGSMTDQQVYDVYASTIEDALRQIDSTASHNRTFGQMWEGVKGWKGQPSVGGFIDVLRKQDLLRPGAMLDPNQLRSALKRAGITTPFAIAMMKAIQDKSNEDR